MNAAVRSGHAAARRYPQERHSQILDGEPVQIDGVDESSHIVCKRIKGLAKDTTLRRHHLAEARMIRSDHAGAAGQLRDQVAKHVARRREAVEE